MEPTMAVTDGRTVRRVLSRLLDLRASAVPMAAAVAQRIAVRFGAAAQWPVPVHAAWNSKPKTRKQTR